MGRGKIWINGDCLDWDFSLDGFYHGSEKIDPGERFHRENIAQQMNRKPMTKKRYRWQERTAPKMFSGRLRFMLPLLAFFGFGKKGFGHYPVEITGRTPQKRCACGCKKLTFSSTYFNLTHAVLHKRELA